MQGMVLVILLLSFFTACWLIIAGYHIVSPDPETVGTLLSRALIMAYTGAALSVVTVAAVIFAAIIDK